MHEPLVRLLETIDRASAKPEDDALFQEVVGSMFKLEVVTLIEAARELRVSLPTLNRWAMGQSAPHPSGRPSVYRWSKERVEQKMKE